MIGAAKKAERAGPPDVVAAGWGLLHRRWVHALQVPRAAGLRTRLGVLISRGVQRWRKGQGMVGTLAWLLLYNQPVSHANLFPVCNNSGLKYGVAESHKTAAVCNETTVTTSYKSIKSGSGDKKE